MPDFFLLWWWCDNFWLNLIWFCFQRKVFVDEHKGNGRKALAKLNHHPLPFPLYLSVAYSLGKKLCRNLKFIEKEKPPPVSPPALWTIANFFDKNYYEMKNYSFKIKTFSPHISGNRNQFNPNHLLLINYMQTFKLYYCTPF